MTRIDKPIKLKFHGFDIGPELLDELQDSIKELREKFGADVRIAAVQEDGTEVILHDDINTFRNLWRAIRATYNYQAARQWVRARNAAMGMERPIDNIEKGIALANALADGVIQ